MPGARIRRQGAALMLALLALLWLLPVFDHHLAERLPHAHLFPHLDTTPHTHAYEDPAHRHAPLPDRTAPQTADEDAAAHGAAVRAMQASVLALVLLASVLWYPAIVTPLRGVARRLMPLPVVAALRPVLITPPHRPPAL